MNKKQLVAKISSTLGQSKADAERTFDSITTIILDALKNDDTVKIAGFGTYKVAKRKARQLDSGHTPGGHRKQFYPQPYCWSRTA